MTDAQPKAPFKPPHSWQELALAGRLKAERLVRALCSVVVFQHPKQQISHPVPALPLCDGVQ